MTRSRTTRAASLALALPPPLEAATTVARALACPSSASSRVIAVSRRGRLIGGLCRGELEHAAGFGLGGVRLSDLLVADPQLVTPAVSPASVRKALNAGPAPFVILRAAGERPSGFIDRQRMAELGLDAAEWGRFSGGKAQSVREALLGCLSAVALEALEELGRRAADDGGRACIVGGVVRDLLLGRPTRDLDVVVQGDLSRLLRGLAAREQVHGRFLTARLELDDGTTLDVAHARAEHYSRPAALPEVESSTVEADLTRRDFTFNTLALALEPGRFGSVLDLCGAVGDLRDHKVRVLHGLSFVDDPTRAFRAVRLAARLGFRIERRTSRAIDLALEHGIFGRLSSARLRREVEFLLGAPEFPVSTPPAARRGLLRVLSPALTFEAGARARLVRASSALNRYAGLKRGERFQRWLVPLGVLLTDAPPRAAGEIVERLRPGRRAARLLLRCRESVRELIARLSRGTRQKPSAVHRACEGLEVEILLVAQACAPRRGTRNAIRVHLESQRGIRLEIGGRDLLRAGVPEGPAVARGLAAALEARLDGRAPGAVEQLRYALQAAGEQTGPA